MPFNYEIMFFLIALSMGCTFDPAAVHDNKPGKEWFQTWWEPCLDCCEQRRMGKPGDGGKWVCMDNATNLTAISIGSNNDFTFEESLLNLGYSEIHVYDHTSRPPRNTYGGRLRFFNEAITPHNFPTILARLPRPHIFKMDCEGCESSVLTPNNVQLLGNQILVELHWSLIGKKGVVHLWHTLTQAGYGAFHKEPNIAFSDGSCIEYALKKI